MTAPLSLSCERIILACDEQTHQHSGVSINPESESKASSPGGCKFTEWEQLLTSDLSWNLLSHWSLLETWPSSLQSLSCPFPIWWVCFIVLPIVLKISVEEFSDPVTLTHCAFWMLLSVLERVWKGSIGKGLLSWLEWTLNVFCMQPNPFRWLSPRILSDNSGLSNSCKFRGLSQDRWV